MPVRDGTVVSTPIVHDIIGRLKGTLTRETRREPRAWPSIIRAFPDLIRYFIRQIDGIAFYELQDWSNTLDDIDTDHRGGHLTARQVTRRESAATEITIVCRAPLSSIQAGLLVLFRHLPERLDNRIAIAILDLTTGIKAGCTGIDEMQEALAFFSLALEFIARCLLDSLRAPIRTDISENLRAIRQELVEKHGHTIERIILRCQDVAFTCTFPVKRRVHERFSKIAVRIEVRPLTLPLETAGNRIMADSLFLTALWQVRIAIVEVLHDAHHLDDKFPSLFFLLVRLARKVWVLVKAFLAVLFCPSQSLLILFPIIDTFRHTADNLDLINRFNAHA